MDGQHYIYGELDSRRKYLTSDLEWSSNPNEKMIGSFEEMCEILDEYFVHGEFNSISGIISPVDAKV